MTGAGLSGATKVTFGRRWHWVDHGLRDSGESDCSCSAWRGNSRCAGHDAGRTSAVTGSANCADLVKPTLTGVSPTSGRYGAATNHGVGNGAIEGGRHPAKTVIDPDARNGSHIRAEK